jgi:hypothetical protein
VFSDMKVKHVIPNVRSWRKIDEITFKHGKICYKRSL